MKSKLIDCLKKFDFADIIEIETNDKQFIAIKKLWEKIKDKNLFIKLVLSNALLSYQLQTTGEKYWQNFSEFFSHNDKSLYDLNEFIKIYNKRLFNQRLKRLKKIYGCISPVNEKDIEKYEKNPILLLDYISNCMKQKKEDKTVVFSIKMFLYAIDIIHNKHFKAPYKILLPLDSRIKRISTDKNFWFDIEKQTNIPLLHIDTILWMSLSDDYNLKKLLPIKTLLKNLF